MFFLVADSMVQIRFVGDPTGEFTKALDLGFDAYAIFGGVRSKRYALVVENGKVKSVHVEPDNTGTSGELHLPFSSTNSVPLRLQGCAR